MGYTDEAVMDALEYFRNVDIVAQVTGMTVEEIIAISDRCEVN